MNSQQPRLHLALAFLAVAFACPDVSLAAPRVELELVFEDGFPLGGQQQWVKMLGPVGFDNLRIRQAGGGEKPEVVKAGTEASPIYKVRGVLTRSNALYLPGGKFSVRDSGRLTAWKAKLLASGGGSLEPKRMAAFGLSTDQLVATHERLADTITFKTQGRTPKEVVRNISPIIGGVIIDPAAIAAFEQEWTVPEEYQNVAAGTALAATIRPLGLVLVPKAVSENDVRLVIVDVRKAPQSWPVGWPPEKKERELAPNLFEFFTFEAPGNPLTEALGALQPAVDMPFLMDHNGLARQRIDPAKAMIEFPEARSYYKKVISRLLFQAKLKGEVRVDEAGQPFLWISPLKQG